MIEQRIATRASSESIYAIAELLCLDLDWDAETCCLIAALVGQAGLVVKRGSLIVDAFGEIVATHQEEEADA